MFVLIRHKNLYVSTVQLSLSWINYVLLTSQADRMQIKYKVELITAR